MSCLQSSVLKSIFQPGFVRISFHSISFSTPTGQWGRRPSGFRLNFICWYLIGHLGKGNDPLQGHLLTRTNISGPSGELCVLLFMCACNYVPINPNYVAPCDGIIVKNKLKKMWKEAAKILSLPASAWSDCRISLRISGRIVGPQTEIWTRNLTNMKW